MLFAGKAGLDPWDFPILHDSTERMSLQYLLPHLKIFVNKYLVSLCVFHIWGYKFNANYKYRLQIKIQIANLWERQLLMTQSTASYLSAALAESQKPKTQHTQEWKNSVQILNHILILRVLYHFANTFHQIIIFCDKKRVMRVANLRGIFRARLAKTRMTFDLPRSSFQYHLQLPDILISKCSPANFFTIFF